MSAYLKNAPAGVVGDVTRMGSSIVEPIMQGSQFAGFGLPVKFDANGKAIPFAGAEVAADFKGILTRVAPAVAGSMTQGLNDAIPNLESAQGLLKFGYCDVQCKVGTPVRGGIVYVRVVAAAPKAIGDFEATSDSTNSVALTNAEWAVSGKDADNITEIRLK